MEIDQQAQGSSTQFQVREKLRFVDGKHSLLRLEFDDYCVLDDKLEPISNVDHHTVIGHRKDGFVLDAKAAS